MLFGNREPRSLVARRRGACRPGVQALEPRTLLASNIDLGGGSATAPGTNPAIATGPFGILETGAASRGGAGFSVTDVGDLTADGFDDFVVGGPGVTNTNGIIDPAPVGTVATAYLIFGSATTNANTIKDWLTLTAANFPAGSTNPSSYDNQRVGNLTSLGNTSTSQNNPITGQPSYPFAGVKFITSQQTGSMLGASVAAAGTINGQRAFLIGAPGGQDANNQNAGTGRAYLIYGGAGLVSLGSTNATVDLDNAGQGSGVNFVTFIGTSGSLAGRSVAGVGDIYGGATNEIAIGAPGATADGRAAAGAVFVLSGASLPTAGQVLLSSVGQTGGQPGVQFTGESSGDQAGFSVSYAGNIDADTVPSTGATIQDLLIGAPNANSGTGAAYLVYGNTQLPSLALPAGTNGNNEIQLARVGGATAAGVRGVVVLGQNVGDQTGFSVSSAGNFNGDTTTINSKVVQIGDFIVGSPGYRNSSGRADLFYGASTTAGGVPPTGTLTLGAVPSNVNNVTFTGTTGSPDLVGFAVGFVQSIATLPVQNPGNPVLIGSPGFQNGRGAAYVIPSNSLVGGPFILPNSGTNPNVLALQLQATPLAGASSPPFFGASVGSLWPDPLSPSRPFTGDGDTLPDFIIGAPNYAVNAASGLNGAAFILESAFIGPNLQVPTANNGQLTSTIGGIDTVNNFVVSATAPNQMLIYVFSNAAIAPGFNPFTSLDPKTVVVNGVAFTNATISQDPVDENADGIPDAIITIAPRSSLNLLSTTTVLTLTAKTLATSLFPNQTYSSQAAITVTGGGTGGGGGGLPGVPSTGGGAGVVTPVGQAVATSYLAQYGPDIYVPSLTTLSQLNTYKPIPERVAIQQFLPGPGFSQRMYYFAHPNNLPKNQFGYAGGNGHQGHRTSSLGSKVFTRTSYKPNKTVEFTHRTAVVPVNLQHEQLAGPIAGVTRLPANLTRVTAHATAAIPANLRNVHATGPGAGVIHVAANAKPAAVRAAAVKKKK